MHLVPSSDHRRLFVGRVSSAVDAHYCAVRDRSATCRGQSLTCHLTVKSNYRIGIHIATIISRLEYIFGDGVNIAVRL